MKTGSHEGTETRRSKAWVDRLRVNMMVVRQVNPKPGCNLKNTLTPHLPDVAILDYVGGAYRIRLAGVTATCTASDGVPLLRAWLRAADKELEKAAA